MKIRVNGHHNMARACNANIWDASVVFGWHIRHHVAIKHCFSQRCWKRRNVFFLLRRHMVAGVERFVIGSVFFSLSCPWNFVLFIEILTLALIFFIFNFCSWPFCKISIYFQFHPWI
jgi:hypothetical protein